MVTKAVSGGPSSVMLTRTRSVTAALWPSETFSVKMTVVLALTCGAVNVVDAAVALSKAMARPVELWDHR